MFFFIAMFSLRILGNKNYNLAINNITFLYPLEQTVIHGQAVVGVPPNDLIWRFGDSEGKSCDF
jgi:hypothetical protein